MQLLNKFKGLPWWLSDEANEVPTKETRVRSLIPEDPSCRGATKPGCNNSGACAVQGLGTAPAEYVCCAC